MKIDIFTHMFPVKYRGGMVPCFDQRIITWYDLAEADNLEPEASYIRGVARRPIEYFRVYAVGA